MKEPIRILQIVNVMDRAGIETMLMNHYRAIDRSCVQFDFLTHRPVSGAYDEEIRSLGGRVFRAPRLYPQNCLAYQRYMRAFFNEHYYPVVHSHIDAMSAFPLAMARDCRVAVRIAHAHSDSVDRDFRYPIKQVARRRLPKVATHFWACSEASGTFLFGKKNRNRLRVVKNAISLERFVFDLADRASTRAELGLRDDQVAIGHVGRFSAVKNQAFLLDVLGEFAREGRDVVLALIGDGEQRNAIERKAASMDLSGSVRFLGLRDDVARLMCGFDVLCFPSFHEGIPVTLIEAQASGLPVLTSNKVSSEALVLPNSRRLSLDASLGEWTRELSDLVRVGRHDKPLPTLAAAGYDIEVNARELMESYVSLHEGATR